MTDGDVTGGLPAVDGAAEAAQPATAAAETLDPMVAIAQSAAEQVVPKPKAATPPNPAAQRVAAKTAAKAESAEAVADATADLETRLRAEFQNTIAVNNAVTAEALRLGMDPEHLPLFAGCKTPEEVSVQSETLAAYLGKAVQSHATAMLEQMKQQGYTLVKNGAAATAITTNGAEPVDPNRPSPLQFAIPLANASKPGGTPGKPTTFAEAAAMVARGQNIVS